MGKYSNDPPHQKKELNQSGMITNACQEQPNGMPFSKPEVEQYFTDMQNDHWRDEDRYKLPTSGGLVGDFDMSDWDRRQRVEHARFLHRPVTGGGE